MIKRYIIILTFMLIGSQVMAQEFELVNNFLMNYSFVTGTNRGMDQNLDDNLSWMTGQGYTHLRFFGIFPNGIHCFPSPTLDANGYPNSAYHEPVLEQLVPKAALYNITVNFDGWEIIAEANNGSSGLGVDYITPEELGLVVQEVLDLGVTQVTEEQFGSDYLQAIQARTIAAGAIHETTAALWYQYPYASLIADEQLVSVFNFFPRNQYEADSIIAAGHGYDIVATLGVCHPFLESPRHFNIATSLAVGSFGTLQTENWRNVLRFAQMQHHPDRLSIEEQDHAFLIENGFNFSDYIKNDLVALRADTIGERPIVNLVLDAGKVYSGTFLPSWPSYQVSAPAIVGTFTPLGYKVIATIDSLLPEADIYYVLLAGGTDASNVAPMPDYVQSLLDGTKPVFFQPVFGIPDDNDATDWLPLRSHFGLPSGDTQTLFNEIPETVLFDGQTTMWGGIDLYLTPCLELLPSSQVNSEVADIVLSADVSGQETALIIANGNSWLVNSNVLHLEASYILSNLLSGPVNSPAQADIVLADGKGLIFAEYDTGIDIDLPWSGNTHIVRYDPAGELVFDLESDLGGSFSTTLERGELVILRSLPPLCGDCNSDGLVNILDIVYIIDYKYKDGPAPDPMEIADVDGLPPVNILDIVYLINFKYKNGPEPACTY